MTDRPATEIRKTAGKPPEERAGTSFQGRAASDARAELGLFRFGGHPEIWGYAPGGMSMMENMPKKKPR
ncbi:hypothetical protein ACF07G_09570, partial [Streptomyces virginiae]